MRIQTEYTSFESCWMISSSYDFQAHQQCSLRRCCFFQTALQWFELLPDLSPALQGLWSALPVLLPALPGAPMWTLRPLGRSSKLWDLTTLGFWSDNSQTLPEAPSDIIVFCWCKYSSKLARLHPPNSHDHDLQVYLSTRSITASKFALSWPPSAYLQTRSITAS